jgi:hypothetical protein
MQYYIGAYEGGSSTCSPTEAKLKKKTYFGDTMIPKFCMIYASASIST